MFLPFLIDRVLKKDICQSCEDCLFCGPHCCLFAVSFIVCRVLSSCFTGDYSRLIFLEQEGLQL